MTEKAISPTPAIMFGGQRRRRPTASDDDRDAFWLILMLLALVAFTSLGLVIWSLVRGGQLDGKVNTQSNSTGTDIETLQTLLNQSALTFPLNGTNVTLLGPGVAVGLALGVGLVYRTVPSPNAFGNDLVWDVELWDDAAYWDSGTPDKLVLPATGRYAIGLNCRKCCTLATTTAVEGYVKVVYSTTTEPETHCPVDLAVQPINDTSAGAVPIPAANLYGEFELTGGTGEFLAVDPVLTYLPSTPGSPAAGPPDDCTFTARYIGRATGTPMVPLFCDKRRRQ
jgi:hypothetical protein